MASAVPLSEKLRLRGCGIESLDGPYSGVTRNQITGAEYRELRPDQNGTVDGGQLCDTEGDRDYSAAAPTEFVGTADFAGVDGVRVVCPDWKTGWTDLGDPRESLTMRFYSLAAARVAGVNQALSGFVYLREDGTASMKWTELDAVDLAETAERLRELAARLQATPTRNVNEGAWCTYCPAWESCPAKVQLAAALYSGLVVDAFDVQSMTLEQLGQAYRKSEQVGQVTKRIREAIREHAKLVPIPLGDGEVLTETDWTTTSINPKVALPVIRDMHGDEAAARASPPEVTQASLKRAVGNANFKTVFAAIERAVAWYRRSESGSARWRARRCHEQR